MPDLVGLGIAFAIGATCAAAIAHLRGRRDRDGEHLADLELPRATPPEPPAPRAPPDPADLERVTESLASELADLATGVEGHAQLLCEAIGDPAQVASQAQRLWSAVRKLRLFSEKVVASCRPPAGRRTATDVRELLSGLRQELEDYSGAGLQVRCETALSLPRALTHPAALRRASLFLVDTLLDLETDAGVLVLRASTRIADDQAPSVEIEIQVESENAPLSPPALERPLALGYVAARNLMQSLGAQIALEHTPGVCSTARIHLEAAPPDPAPPEAAAPPSAGRRHPFGGILIVEDDPSVRSVVAREMEKTGRRVFCCADGTAARSLLTATPERFELLILDREARRQPGAKLAAEALSCSPDLKILLLGAEPRPHEDAGPGLGDRCRLLHKPFGITELRDAVGGLLGPAVHAQVGA